MRVYSCTVGATSVTYMLSYHVKFLRRHLSEMNSVRTRGVVIRYRGAAARRHTNRNCQIGPSGNTLTEAITPLRQWKAGRARCIYYPLACKNGAL